MDILAMKSWTRILGWLVASAGIAAPFAFAGCSDVPSTGWEVFCDSTPFAPNPDCIKQSAPDAGSDADVESDAANAVENPGLDTSYWVAPDACKTGICVPDPNGSGAILWANVPISLWIGPVAQVPAQCPDEPVYGVPTEKFRGFDQLVAPPAACSPCSCEPSEGTCSGVPDTLELRAGTCAQNGTMTVPFDAPANWDGSCTNADTIAAGTKCPAGSQTLCTQSVHSSALPVPTNEACKPSASVPSFTLETSWEIGALACTGNTQPQSCGTTSLTTYCVNDPGPAWLQCTYRAGVHEQCPDNYQYARYVFYPKEPIDNRGCSTCECGATTGSACVASLSLSTDGTCSTQNVNLQVGSTGAICYDFLVPGMAIGSKAIVNRTYLSGVCAANGGEAVGSAIADEENAVTFCCMQPYVEIDPPH